MDDDDEIDPNYLLKMYTRQHETGGDVIYLVGFMAIIYKRWCYLSPINTEFNEGSFTDFFIKRLDSI